MKKISNTDPTKTFGVAIFITLDITISIHTEHNVIDDIPILT